MIQDGEKKELTLPFEEHLTEKQKKILLHYWDTFSLRKACEYAGVTREYIFNARRYPNSKFSQALREVTEMLENDDRVGKVGTLEALLDIERRAREAGDMNVELKVRQEINKMIERNLAIQKKSIETVNIDVKGVLDLTQTKEIESGSEDVDYENLSYEEEEGS